ncbi:hypothetical protein EUX98_g4023 [Antrodiella citrinella]|uniref:Uncharacterized protein n=1 Tax=Antrodiella citrinella TaxID=2447956 RepID=A0A4V3XIR4_9APHY|nr:hypothetical protein EUX98_g4023 [Antrodiella citrinella]
MRIRRRVLGEAEQTVKEEQQLFVAHATTLGTKRDALSTLRNQAPPLRSAALASLASIYPIELVSPPDLLFSILDVALPIPLGSTDPAPPISLPAFRDINEDTVATALGFAAHVVQLLAAYMNKNLIYPITYVGSRSLIKDGISAMVGPRMFPLFSKGVDTYRFEYAVFLLNKNIELLMADRDLRALDMRHTLPNLKNLLLTLTDPEGPPHQRLRPETMSQSDSGLHSPSTASSMLSEDDIAERNEEAQADSCTELPAETSTIASAGSTTPTNATTKKTRNFLDLGPLTGFLRSRYPSTSRTAGNVEADGEATAANGTEAQSSPSQDADLDDDDDRRTIRDTRSEHAEDKAETPIVREDVPTTNGTTQVAAGDAAAVEKAKSQLTAASLLSRGQVSV